VVPTSQALFKNTFTYHTVSCSPPEWEECFAFLDAARAANAKVMVYCMTCASRSPAVVVGYLMRLRGWRLGEAYRWVRDKRGPGVRISPGDTTRLAELEASMYGTCSLPAGGFDALDGPPDAFVTAGGAGVGIAPPQLPHGGGHAATAAASDAPMD